MPVASVTPTTPLYTHTNLAQARIQLGDRLQDSGNSFWAAPELNSYIAESLRTFQAFTGYYRTRIVFAITPDDQFYSLSAVSPTEYGPTIIDTDIVKDIQYSLLEPATGVNWTGTTQFTYPQVVAALQNSLNQFLLATGICQWRVMVNTPTPSIAKVILPSNVIDIRRLGWRERMEGKTTPIYRDSDFSTQYLFPYHPYTAIPPLTYSVSSNAPNIITLHPPPYENGQLDLTYISTYSVNPAFGQELPVPDAYATAIKWGALHSLLSTEGYSRDPHRAGYSLRRFDAFAELATAFPSVLGAWIDDLPIPMLSLQNLDTYCPGWQNRSGKPSMMAAAGRDMIAFDCWPDRVYTITLDVAGNIPTPVVDADQLQIGKDLLDGILGYSQHLAAFKQGGLEFDHTFSLLRQFLSVATLYNRHLSATNFYRSVMNVPISRQADEVQRFVRPVDVSLTNLASRAHQSPGEQASESESS